MPFDLSIRQVKVAKNQGVDHGFLSLVFKDVAGQEYIVDELHIHSRHYGDNPANTKYACAASYVPEGRHVANYIQQSDVLAKHGYQLKSHAVLAVWNTLLAQAKDISETQSPFIVNGNAEDFNCYAYMYALLESVSLEGDREMHAHGYSSEALILINAGEKRLSIVDAGEMIATGQGLSAQELLEGTQRLRDQIKSRWPERAEKPDHSCYGLIEAQIA